ncbi:hypothetical protein HY311_02445 [Candidatus Nomurabacteria bacterium]|nr:hypothetical protein [Candidatus Nomurabacteria bacterium]
MPPSVGTEDEILKKLNEDAATKASAPWIALRGFQAWPLATITPNVNFDLNQGIIVKNFASMKTGEIKTFLTKLLNVEGRNNLYNK